MFFVKQYFNKTIFSLISILILCSFATYFITSMLLLPNRIEIVEGEERLLNFKLPLTATFDNEAITTFKINNKSVSKDSKVNLINENTLTADNFGTSNITLNALGVPLKNISVSVLPELELVPCGLTVGVNIESDGIMILATGYVNTTEGTPAKPSEGVLKPGDLVLKMNGSEIFKNDEFKNLIEESKETINLVIKRNEEIIETSIQPVKSADDSKMKIGVWVRDHTKGIGTITYYDPETNNFGALGHGIVDIDTKKLMSIRKGEITQAVINDVKKGKKGIPGELVGDILNDKKLGTVKTNTILGLYGLVNQTYVDSFSSEKMKIALQSEITEGPAKIRSNVMGEKIEEFDIYIETVNRMSSDESKGMVIRITDPKLIELTNGIVQGMSGSPIIQNGKLVGAVTHVFVQEPTKGYGIFIENMLKQQI